MKKSYIYIIIVLVVAAGFFFFVKKNNNQISNTSSENATTSSDTTGQTNSTSTNPSIIKAWQTFDVYLSFLKQHNTDGVKSISYQQSDTCKNKATQDQCFALMDNVYNISHDFKRELFTNVSEDGKQLILYTDPVRDQVSTSTVGLIRGYIFFTKTDNGDLRVLSLTNGKGQYITSTTTPISEMYKELEADVKDTDKDGLYDVEEECLGVYKSDSCKKTDPNNKDTNGNGWWDGIEVFFNKK